MSLHKLMPEKNEGAAPMSVRVSLNHELSDIGDAIVRTRAIQAFEHTAKAYPIHLRGTGESFAANIGGRMFGTPFAFLTQQIALFSFIPGETPAAKTAVVAAGVAFTLYLANLIFSTVLPEQGAEHAD